MVQSDSGSLDNCHYGPSSTMDAFTHLEDSHFHYSRNDEQPEVPIDYAHEISCNIDMANETANGSSLVEHEPSEMIRDLNTQIENLDDEEMVDQQHAKSGDMLSESLSTIARRVGKFHPKPRSGGLAINSKAPKGHVTNRSVDEEWDLNGEEFGSFGISQMQDEQTKDISGHEEATPNSNGNEKFARKRKKPSDETTKAPLKKKFSHSTRRKRRLVDKTLLETPEDEIDSRKLRIRDLIMLAESRERMSVKAGSKGLSSNNRSNGDPSSNSNYYEGTTYAEGHGLNPMEDDTTPEADTNPIKLNYHTYMKKSRQERWSKTDMELFYQAIRQFGTDFGMIQQLFPNRTRHQVHLKFKNEERKHPLQIADALACRSKDHSHFKQVIEQLKAKAEEDKADVCEPESQDDPTIAADEVDGVKKSDDGDQEGNDADYNGSTMMYDEEDYDWAEYDNPKAPYGYDDEY